MTIKTHESYFMFLCERDQRVVRLSEASEVSLRSSAISARVIDQSKTILTIVPKTKLPKFLAGRLQNSTVEARYSVFSLSSGQSIRGYVPLKPEGTSNGG